MCYLCNRKPQCTMNRRLQKFLDAENVSQSQFADSINVARASVSHIIAGRNKPGFDFVEKMARAYPMLNVEWLITGKGKMYKDNSATASTSPLPVMDDDLFAQYDEPDMKPEPSPKHEATPLKPEKPKAPAAEIIESIAKDNTAKLAKGHKVISKIIALFDDGSYQVMSQ